MVRITAISSSLALRLGHELDLNDKLVDRVRFGLEVMVGSLLKAAILLCASRALGVQKDIAVAVLAILPLRLLAGGSHCSSWESCALFSMALCFSLVYGAMYLSTCWLAGLMQIPLLVVTLVLVLAYAPVDAIGKIPRRVAKLASMGTVLVASALCLSPAGNFSRPYSSLICLSVFAAALSMTPMARMATAVYDASLRAIASVIERKTGGGALQ